MSQKTPPVILLLSNVNLEPLQEREDRVNIHYDGFNTLGRRLSEGFDTLQGQYDRIWIHADLNFPGLVNGDFRNSDIGDLRDATITMLDQWIEKLTAHPHIRFLFSTFSFRSLWNQGQRFFERQQELNHTLNAWLIHRIAGHANIDLFPFDRLIAQEGELSVYDDRLWIIGRIPYTYAFLDTLHREMCESFFFLGTPPRKVLVLDLDNTLWGGTLDEQESSPLVLDVEGPGLAYRNFQGSIKTLQQRGILLAVVSKNDEKEVGSVFENHPYMALEKDDFVEILANWENKSANLRELSERLGLSPDSFVMIDDNPRERAEIAQHLPEVALPKFPEDPADLERWFYEGVVTRYFNIRAVTEADTQRAARYRSRKKRQNTANRYADIESFLRSLEIHLHIAEAKPEERARVSQLLQRTNQFNLNKDPDLLQQALVNESGRKTWVLHYQDIFGVEGLVGAIVLKQGDAPAIESFAVSCRVLGKRVEHALLLKALANVSHSQQVSLCFQSTGKNRQMAEFLHSLGGPVSGNPPVVKSVAELVESLKRSVQCITHEPS